MKGFRESTRGGSSKLQLQQCLCADPLCRRGHHPSILPYHTSKRAPFFDQQGNRSAISTTAGSLQEGTPAGALENLWVAILRGPLAWGGLLGSRAPGVSPGCPGKPPGSPGAPGNLPLQSYLGTPGGTRTHRAKRCSVNGQMQQILELRYYLHNDYSQEIQSIHYS